MLSWLKIKWELRGGENLDVEEPCIIICNHQSFLDMHALYNIWGPRTLPLSKLSLLFNPLGVMLWLSGAPFIDRSNTERAKITMDNCVTQVKEKKMKLIIFPEGTRNLSTDPMLPFKKGGFHLAIKGKFKIIPVVFSSFGSFYNFSESKFESRGFGVIEVLPAIEAEKYNKEQVDELCEEVKGKMIESFGQITQDAETIAMHNSL